MIFLVAIASARAIFSGMATRIGPISTVTISIARGLQRRFPTYLYSSFIAPICHSEWRWLVKLHNLSRQISGITAISSFIVPFNNKCTILLINIDDSVVSAQILEVKYACGLITVETRVQRITTVWPGAQWIGYHNVNTRFTVSCFQACNCKTISWMSTYFTISESTLLPIERSKPTELVQINTMKILTIRTNCTLVSWIEVYENTAYECTKRRSVVGHKK